MMLQDGRIRDDLDAGVGKQLGRIDVAAVDRATEALDVASGGVG